MRRSGSECLRSRVRVAYVPTIIAALGGATGAACLDLRAPVALVPLSLTLGAPILVATTRRHRTATVAAAVLLQSAIVFLAGFTIGLWFLPSVLLLLAAAGLELWLALRNPTTIDGRLVSG
jgi:hypothetical protein